MAPTPEIIESIRSSSNENDSAQQANSFRTHANQTEYTNNAFIRDELSEIDLVPSNKNTVNHCDDENASKKIDFDDILPHIGEFGTYQKILFLLMIPFAFFVAFVYFTQIFITLVPEKHWCRIPELEHLSVNER